jgi:hypothetical protein
MLNNLRKALRATEIAWGSNAARLHLHPTIKRPQREADTPCGLWFGKMTRRTDDSRITSNLLAVNQILSDKASWNQSGQGPWLPHREK